MTVALPDGIVLVDVAHPPGTTRAQARLRVRSSLCAAAASQFGVSADRLAVVSEPGHPPRLLLDGHAFGAYVSISHADSHSLAVIGHAVRVGIDVMEVGQVDEWRTLARDYLGPRAVQRLDAEPEATRMAVLAQEWTAREACLKCLGLQLSEWSALPMPCKTVTLAAGSGYAASLAHVRVPGTQQ